MIFVNFKAFQEGTGGSALNLVSVLEAVSTESQTKVIPCVTAIDLREVASHTILEVWIQNIDSNSFGAHTGSILAEDALDAGAVGTLLNHSEHRSQSFDELKTSLEHAQKIGLKTLIFAKDLEELEKVAQLKPTFVSYEPPQLIGSTTESVASAQPEIISKAVEIARKHGIPLIVGAGIHSGEDVRKSRELGAVGVAVATDIVKAQDPKKEILDLIEGFK